jgi:nicotinamidase/pyrazinamidase
MKNALIIVDVQNDFLPGGALPIPQGDEVVPVINRLTEVFDLVIATQDWHPADHVSFVSQHPGCKVGEIIELQGEPRVL